MKVDEARMKYSQIPVENKGLKQYFKWQFLLRHLYSFTEEFWSLIYQKSGQAGGGSARPYILLFGRILSETNLLAPWPPSIRPFFV